MTEAFKDTGRHLVYLTPPDSETTLTELEPSSAVYVIDGLVDDSIKKSSSHSFACGQHIFTARLPIEDNAVKKSSSESPKSSFFKKVLDAINQVFEILLKFKDTGSWADAFQDNLPKHFGFKVKGTDL